MDTVFGQHHARRITIFTRQRLYRVTFDGFTALYEEATDEKEKKETALPPLEAGPGAEAAASLRAEQKFTQPPARTTPKQPSSRRWKKTASAALPPMRPSSPPSSTAAMWKRDQKKLKPTLLGRAVDQV